MRHLVALALIAIGCGGEIEPPPSVGNDGASYNPVTSTSAWSTAELWKLLGEGNNLASTAFNGGTFDGRYVYLASQTGGLVRRFDATMQLSAASAWESFDTQLAEAPQTLSFAGAAFDGRYVYFASYEAVVVRYDSQAPFGAATSWTTFNASGFAAQQGFAGVVFDGRYLLFMPFGLYGHIFVRYDTQGAFDAVDAWSTFDATSANADAANFCQGVFDGHYIYTLGNDANGNDFLARYDTLAPFTSASSWTFFDPSVVYGSGHSKRGLVFDGRYVYLATGPNGEALRFDTQAPFTDASSWIAIDLRSLAPPHWDFVDVSAADFDGRYVYFVAETFNAPASEPNTFILQCDTQTPFESASSCSSLDATTALSSYADSFYTAVFDGRFMYFASDTSTTIARFDVKSPPSIPALPAFHGSFF